MVRRWLTGLLALALLTSTGGRALSLPQPPGPQPALSFTAAGFTAEWSAPAPSLANGLITMPGYPQLQLSETLSLPVAARLLALPPGARPTLTLTALTETNVGATPLVAALPPVRLEVLGVMRGLTLARLIFYPARPVAGQVRWTAHVTVRVDYGGPADLSATPVLDSDPLRARLRSLVANPAAAWIAPTPTGGRAPHALTAPTLIAEVTQPGLTALTYASLAALNPALVAADPRQLHLRRAGVEIAYDWDGDADALFEPGESLLFYADPRFSRWTRTDAYFISAEATPGLRLTTRTAAPGNLPAQTAWVSQVFESNTYYTPNCYECRIPLGRDGDRWVWDLLRRPDRVMRDYPFALPDVAATLPATLTVWLVGYTDIPSASLDHRVSVAVNGAPVGQVEWNGKQAITATFTVPAGRLNPNNTLTLALPGLPGILVEGAWLDAFALTYARGAAPVGNAVRFGLAPSAPVTSTPAGPQRLYLPLIVNHTGAGQFAYSLALAEPGPYRAYDITDPANPVRLTEVVVAGNTLTFGGLPARDYLVTTVPAAPANLRVPIAPQTVSGADYLILAHPAFMPALAPLIALRQSQGLQVVVENVQAAYDADDGRATPDAIRAYLAEAYAHWTPRPTYVLLVGDGVYDVKNYLGDSPATFIPPYLAEVDPLFGETAADNRYVTVDGADNLPDLLIGRLPVNTLAEAQTVVSKLVGYETDATFNSWSGRALLVADDADTAGNFAAQSQTLAAAYFTPPLMAFPYYYTAGAPVEPMHQALLTQWNSGAGLVAFIGHASDVQWAVERLLHVDDVAALQNGLQLPVVLDLTCFTGSFHQPYPTLDEALVRAPTGGALAAWGATGEGVSTGHSFLAEGFMGYMYARPAAERTLGQATLEGKLELLASGSAFIDLVDTYTLLGDPATRLNLKMLALTNTLYLPLIER